MKRKINTILIASTLLVSGLACAANNPGNQGGFSGPSTSSTTVAEAKNKWDDADVVMKGYIVSAQGGEHYLFKDQTGEIQVEIDHDVWRGLTVGPEDLVELTGEVDKDWSSIKIDVDRIIKVTN